MSILINKQTRVICQGITGKAGAFHTKGCKDYGTQMVGGVTPGKAGETVEGLPVFDTVIEAVEKTGANATMIFVPAAFTADAILEALDAGIKVIAAITEGVPWGERGTGFGPLMCSGNSGMLTYTRSGADKTKNWTVADHVQETDVTAHVLIISDGADVRAGCANFF